MNFDFALTFRALDGQRCVALYGEVDGWVVLGYEGGEWVRLR